MVSITDTFTRMYGREPTVDEIAKMMRMKADQEQYRQRVEYVSQKKAGGTKRKPKAKRMPKTSKRTVTVNKLLMYGLTVSQIADALDLEKRLVEHQIKVYELPRSDVHVTTWGK